MNVRKLVILGKNDSAKNRLIRTLLGLEQNDGFFPGVDRYFEVVNIAGKTESLEILNVTGDARYKQLAAQHIIGADYVWFVLSADENACDDLDEWYQSADFLAFGMKPLVIVWQEKDQQTVLHKKTLSAFLHQKELPEACSLWLHAADGLKFAEVFQQYYSSEYLARPQAAPVIRARIEPTTTQSRLKGFATEHAYLLAALPVVLLGLSVAAYFAWPALLAVASASLASGPAAVAVLSVVVPVAIMCLSGVSAVAVDRTAKAFSKICRSTTANVFQKMAIDTQAVNDHSQILDTKKDEVLREEPRLLNNQAVSFGSIRQRR